jgi:hypothetical protein
MSTKIAAAAAPAAPAPSEIKLIKGWYLNREHQITQDSLQIPRDVGAEGGSIWPDAPGAYL